MNASTAFPTEVTLSVALAVQNGIDIRNIILGVIGLTFNIVAIFFLFLSKRVRPTLKITLLSMAFNDGIFMLSAALWGFGLECWPILYIVACSILVSYFITSAIALHNYTAVFYPLRCRNILSLKRSLLLVLSCWLGGYAIALAFLGVRVPAETPCFLVTAMSRPLIVVYSAICLLCCCFVTVASVKVLACIRRRYQTIALRPLRNAQEHGQSALISINEVQFKRCRVNMWPFRRCTVAPMSENTFAFTENAGLSKISAPISSKIANKPNQEYDLSTPKDVQKNHVKCKNTNLDKISEYVQSTSGQNGDTKCNKLITVRPARQHNSDEEQSVVGTNSWTREILQDGHHHKDAPYYVKSKSNPRPRISDKNYLKVPPAPGLKLKSCMDTCKAVDDLRKPKKRCSHDSEPHGRMNRASDSMVDHGKSEVSFRGRKCPEGFTDSDIDESSSSGRRESSHSSEISESHKPHFLVNNDDVNKLINTVLTVPLHMNCHTENSRYKTLSRNVKNQNNFKMVTTTNISPPTVLGGTDITNLSSSRSQSEFSKCYDDQKSCMSTNTLKHKSETGATGRIVDEEKCISDSTTDKAGKFPNHSDFQKMLIKSDDEQYVSTTERIDSSDDLTYSEKQKTFEDVDENQKSGFNTENPENEPISAVEHLMGSQRSRAIIATEFKKHDQLSDNKRLSSALRNISVISPKEIIPVNIPHSTPCAGSTNEGHPSESFNTDSSVLSYPDSTDQIILDRSANQSTPTLTRHQIDRGDKRWHFRTQYTLLILCSWCCFLSLPYIVYATYVAIWLEDRLTFQRSSVGMLCSSLVGLNSITNPLLYAWRFVEWRDIWRRIRRANSRR